MELITKQGYKQTEVGLIPRDWDLHKIESLTPFGVKYGIVDGPFGSNLKTEHYKKKGIPIITSGYVTNGYFKADNYLYVDELKFKQEKRSAVKGGDIVMAKIGARCGASAILPLNHEVGILSGNALKISIDEKKYSTILVWQYLQNIYQKGDLEGITSTGAQPAISMSNLKVYQIPLPPTLTEQKAIATALSDVDALITSLEQTITKKKAIKQGAMQQLLTGETRIKGYDNNIKTVDSIYGKIPIDWGIQSIGNVCKIFGRIGFRGYTVNDIVDEASGALSLSPSNIINNKINFKKGTFISWMKYHESPEIKIRKGDIVLVKTASVGKTAIIENLPHKITLNPQLVVLKNVKIDRYYLSYMMSYKIIQNQIITSVAGGVVPTLTQEQISGFTFPIPNSIQEQKAISNTLSDMDTEITQLESKKEKYQAIKQGMMQELLTGKTRLI